ncbi:MULTISPECIES: SIR2 family protein [unclassified Bradyrhizobium]|uniref:SIR2 family protein n=1 Tax=unclassified Bradyrhizobium TaxID=2631580 RepID=UPI001FFB6008|nr:MULTISPECIES: SIR2 family protein [unclassified Bradyrhizobium]MCK1270819.1 SIR2 family protein [Bradyrhizobium sp. 84]MCK1372126.1 SIR2 family protein [Bradyrhizobium sp. 49]MCK1430673.1 SIR2 family protein [Bradyrhizobium sp. 87]
MTSKSISPAVQAFMECVRHFSYQQGPEPQDKALTNFTFFAGAGFSKSWDPKAPIGSELFTLKPKIIERVANMGALDRMFGLDPLREITPERLRQIIYRMDMYDRYPDVRSRYVDEQNIKMFRGALRAAVLDRYDAITKLNYFDGEVQKFPLKAPTKPQQDVLAFFRYLFDRIDGSQPFVEGIRTHFVTTNYDYVIETILDNTLGPDDSLFLYTYRGFTPIDIVNEANIVPVHEHWLVRHLLKINGGFEILRRGNEYVLDYNERSPEQVMRDPPVLMLASREQDYSDPYFRAVFPKAVRLLHETTVLIIVGYSLPPDDALLRFVIRQFAEEAEDGREKIIFYIGPGADEDKKAVIEEVFPSRGTVGVPLLQTYNSGFDQFAAECVQLISADGK